MVRGQRCMGLGIIGHIEQTQSVFVLNEALAPLHGVSYPRRMEMARTMHIMATAQVSLYSGWVVQFFWGIHSNVYISQEKCSGKLLPCP
jgi:hypothetical protein